MGVGQREGGCGLADRDARHGAAAQLVDERGAVAAHRLHVQGWLCTAHRVCLPVGPGTSEGASRKPGSLPVHSCGFVVLRLQFAVL